MWTLTIDPKLFSDDPKAAYEYCREKRVVSQWVRSLRRRGLLLCRHYFAAVEFQKNGMVHYHVLVNAKFIPFQTACDLWNRFRPADAPISDEDAARPAFGSVRFSQARKFATYQHAINYATKYVIKTPKYGWPAWVMESRCNVPRYMASRDFFEDGNAASEPSGYEDEPEDADPEEEPPQRETIAERVAKCRVKGVVMRVDTYTAGQVTWKRATFCGELPRDYAELCHEAGFESLPFRFAVGLDELKALIGDPVLKESDDETCRETTSDRDRAFESCFAEEERQAGANSY